jgi:poly-gamma-glutamate capsule biosynthesis protein CapA/YwtB (metallophosphatase superfamily)
MRRLAIVFVLAALGLSNRAAGQTASSPSSTLRIALVGQALIHEDLRRVAPLAVEQAKGYLKGADVRFTNLETALAPKDMAVELRTPEVHRTGPEVLDALKDMGFNMLSLANNHAWDLGLKGLLAGIGEVSKRGFAYAGTGPDADVAAAAGFMDTPAGKVALIAMASGAPQLAKPDTWAAPGRPGVNYLDLRADGTLDPVQKARILGAVREAARKAKFVIVYQHNHFWGEATGVAAPPNRSTRVNRFDTPPWQTAWTHELIDAGASLYVAHGNPALHGVEIYKGRPILYGLGNYIFNSVGMLDVYGPLAYYSAVAYCDFADGKLVSVRFRPLVLSLDSTADVPRGIPYLAQGGEASAVLERLARISSGHGTKMTIEAETASVVLK